MFHLRHNLLFPPKLPFWSLISIQVLQEFPFCYPLRVYPVKSPDLPPLMTTNDVLEVVRTEPVDQYVRCGVASWDRYRDWSYDRPRRGWNVRV